MVLPLEPALVWTLQRLRGQRDGRLTWLQENERDSLVVTQSRDDRRHHGLILEEFTNYTSEV